MNSTTDIGDSLEYDPERGVYRVNFVRTGCEPSHALLRAIATIEEVDVSSLDPLGSIVDVGGLDSVVRSSFDDGDVNFTYHGYRATIRTDGDIVLDPSRPPVNGPDSAE